MFFFNYYLCVRVLVGGMCYAVSVSVLFTRVLLYAAHINTDSPMGQ